MSDICLYLTIFEAEYKNSIETWCDIRIEGTDLSCSTKIALQTNKPVWNETFKLYGFQCQKHSLVIRIKKRSIKDSSTYGKIIIPLSSMTLGKIQEGNFSFNLDKNTKRNETLRMKFQLSYTSYEPFHIFNPPTNQQQFVARPSNPVQMIVSPLTPMMKQPNPPQQAPQMMNRSIPPQILQQIPQQFHPQIPPQQANPPNPPPMYSSQMPAPMYQQMPAPMYQQMPQPMYQQMPQSMPQQRSQTIEMNISDEELDRRFLSGLGGAEDSRNAVKNGNKVYIRAFHNRYLSPNKTNTCALSKHVDPNNLITLEVTQNENEMIVKMKSKENLYLIFNENGRVNFNGSSENAEKFVFIPISDGDCGFKSLSTGLFLISYEDEIYANGPGTEPQTWERFHLDSFHK